LSLTIYQLFFLKEQVHFSQFFFFFFWGRSRYIAQAALDSMFPASAFWVFGLQACFIMPDTLLDFEKMFAKSPCLNNHNISVILLSNIYITWEKQF
jgi:hypothetical protein